MSKNTPRAGKNVGYLIQPNFKSYRTKRRIVKKELMRMVDAGVRDQTAENMIRHFERLFSNSPNRRR